MLSLKFQTIRIQYSPKLKSQLFTYLDLHLPGIRLKTLKVSSHFHSFSSKHIASFPSLPVPFYTISTVSAIVCFATSGMVFFIPLALPTEGAYRKDSYRIYK